MSLIDRVAARVLLIDAQDRVLLLRGFDPAVPQVWYWFTPGGGLEPGESPAAGAARELYEETGLRVSPDALGEPVWHQVTTFQFNTLWYRQEQEFFRLRVDSWTVDPGGLDAEEQYCINGHHWWSLEQLSQAAEPVYPEGLADLLRQLAVD